MTDLNSPSAAVFESLRNKTTLHRELMFEAPESYSGEFEPIDIENYFRIVPVVAKVEWISDNGYFDIKPGDRYLDYHLLPRDDLGISETKALSDKCYGRIAEIVTEQPDIKYLLGFTYSAIARFAGRQGLETEQVNVHDDLIELVRVGWRELNPDFPEKRFKTLHAVGLSRDDLVTNFSTV